MGALSRIGSPQAVSRAAAFRFVGVDGPLAGTLDGRAVALFRYLELDRWDSYFAECLGSADPLLVGQTVNRVDEEEGWLPVRVTLGIDLACRAPHVESLADDQGRLVWTGRTFQSRVRDLEALWADLGCDPGELTVVMEPTRKRVGAGR